MADKTAARTAPDDGGWVVAKESFIANIDGVDRSFVQGQTRMRANDPRIKHLLDVYFQPLESDYPAFETASADPLDGIIAK